MTEITAGATPLHPRPENPKNVLVVLLDSLNRHLVGAYGSTEFETPNLHRLAAFVVNSQVDASG